MAAPVTPSLTLRISRSWMAAESVRGFELRRADGGDLPAFEPGAHIGVRTPNGAVRKYSLCNDPAERDRYEIAVLRENAGRGGSAAMVDNAQDGADIEIAPPHNDFPLAASPAGYTFIAGGIGITPILSMVRHLKSGPGAKFKLYYCTRSAAGTAFRDTLSAPAFRGQVVFHHDGGDPSRSLDLWPVLEQPKGPVDGCGPRGLMQAVRDMTGHWSPSSVHFEAFTEPQQTRPDDRPFRVKLARADATVEVPIGRSSLEALRAAGHEAASSCESGTCGTCRTRLLAGLPDHRDLVLADHERADNIMICVSRALSDELVLDR